MSDDKINLNGGETSPSELDESRYTDESISAAFASSDTAADQTASQDDEAYSDRVSSILHSEEIVVEHLDELPDVENVEELIGEGHVYDEETAGALVALMFAKEHREEEALAEEILSDEPAKAENADGKDTQVAAPSMLLDKKHSVTILISLILVVLSIIILPILFNNDSTPEPPPPETGDSGNSATDNYPLIFNYFESDGTITITGFKDIPSELVIPNEIDGKPVVTIEQNAFNGCIDLTSVVIPDSVTSIGSRAFYRCNNLTSVTIPDSVTSIGDRAFYECSNLTSVHITDIAEWCGIEFGDYDANPLHYGANLHLNGEEVTDLVIPDGVDKIGDYAFYYCSSLTTVTIPDSVTSVGKYAFQYCDKLTSVHISDIAAWCDIEFGSSCANPLCCAHYLYLDGELVTELVIPEGVEKIGNYSFESCTGITSVVIPDSVTSIGSSAFYRCSGLASVVIPSSVTSIGATAFSNCYNISGVYIDDLSAWCNISFAGSMSNPVCANKDTHNEGSNLYLNSVLVTDLVIPDGITEISEAFTYCKSLSSVTIPDSVTSIGNYAFSGCSNLTSVEIPDSVTSIGDSAFNECSNLTSVHISDVAAWCSIEFGDYDANPLYYGANLYLNGEQVTDLVIPDGVEKISDSAFYNCKSLTSVTIPDSVTSIGNQAFYNCDSLTCVNITDIAAWCGIAFENPPANPLYYAENLHLNGEPVAEIVIPGGVEKIGNYAFYNCKSINSVTIPESVTNIGDYAFCECINLASVAIPNSVTSISGYAFCDCDSLTSVVIPDSVTSIGSRAFAACNNVTIYCEVESKPDGWASDWNYLASNSVVWGYEPASDFEYTMSNGEITITRYIGSNSEVSIPDTIDGKPVVAIDAGAFGYYTNLASVTIGNSVTSIGDYAFSWCGGLTSIAIPDSVTSIGDWAFVGCFSLASIVIPDSVTSIGDNAFSECSSFTSIIIPDSVTSIGSQAFSSCSSLTSVVIPGSVTSIGSQAFRNCSGLTSVVIPDSVTSIDYWAFRDCYSLTSITVDEDNTAYKSIDGNLYTKDGKTLIQYAIGKTDTSFTIPDGLTSIGSYAFDGCSNLTSVVIHDSVTSIGDYAFYDCNSLTIYCEADYKPAEWESDWNYSNCPVIWGYVIPEE